MNKYSKTMQLEKNVLQFTYPQVSIKDAQATGEAFSPQKTTSSTLKHENSFRIRILMRIRIQQLKLMCIHADPVSQP
jgi:hypothetical protein